MQAALLGMLTAIFFQEIEALTHQQTQLLLPRLLQVTELKYLLIKHLKQETTMAIHQRISQPVIAPLTAQVQMEHPTTIIQAITQDLIQLNRPTLPLLILHHHQTVPLQLQIAHHKIPLRQTPPLIAPLLIKPLTTVHLGAPIRQILQVETQQVIPQQVTQLKPIRQQAIVQIQIQPLIQLHPQTVLAILQIIHLTLLQLTVLQTQHLQTIQTTLQIQIVLPLIRLHLVTVQLLILALQIAPLRIALPPILRIKQVILLQVQKLPHFN